MVDCWILVARDAIDACIASSAVAILWTTSSNSKLSFCSPSAANFFSKDPSEAAVRQCSNQITGSNIPSNTQCLQGNVREHAHRESDMEEAPHLLHMLRKLHQNNKTSNDNAPTNYCHRSQRSASQVGHESEASAQSLSHYTKQKDVAQSITAPQNLGAINKC